MPHFETVDRMEIPAPAERLFDVVLDHPRMHEWCSSSRVEVEVPFRRMSVVRRRGTPRHGEGADLHFPGSERD